MGVTREKTREAPRKTGNKGHDASPDHQTGFSKTHLNFTIPPVSNVGLRR